MGGRALPHPAPSKVPPNAIYPASPPEIMPFLATKCGGMGPCRTQRLTSAAFLGLCAAWREGGRGIAAQAGAGVSGSQAPLDLLSPLAPPPSRTLIPLVTMTYFPLPNRSNSSSKLRSLPPIYSSSAEVLWLKTEKEHLRLKEGFKCSSAVL